MITSLSSTASSTARLVGTVASNVASILDDVHSGPNGSADLQQILGTIPTMAGELTKLITSDFQDSLEEEWKENLSEALIALVQQSLPVWASLTRVIVHFAKKQGQPG